MVPWAVRFPYGSPAMRQQFEFGQLTLPKELIYSLSSGQCFPLPREYVEKALQDNGATRKKLEAARAAAEAELQSAKESGVDAAMQNELAARRRVASEKLVDFLRNSEIGIVEKQCIQYGLSAAQLSDLTKHFHSKPVHPTQLYAVINAFLIAWLMSTLFYFRKRHGILLGWFLLIYSVSRVFEEAVRQDNPLDIGGVTISQAVSIVTFLVGLGWMVLMYRLPMTSPRAVKFELPPEETSPPKAKPAK